MRPWVSALVDIGVAFGLGLVMLGALWGLAASLLGLDEWLNR